MWIAIVIAREPPMVLVTEPKLAALLGHAGGLLFGIVEAVQTVFGATGSVVGTVIVLPAPLMTGFWSRFVNADC